MVTVLIELEDAVLRQLLTDADAGNLSLEEHIRQVLTGTRQDGGGVVAPSTDLLGVAVARAEARSSGDTFLLQDLMSNTEWAQVTSPTVFGRRFRQAVEPLIATHIHKNAQNKAVYRRS